MTNPAPNSPAPPAPDLLHELQQLVQRNTRRWKRLLALEMLAVLVAAPLAYLWVVFSLDILVHLPRWGRVATSALFFAVLVVLGRWLWRRWCEVRLTEDQVALAIEQQSPGTSNRLINSLQISREAGSGGSDYGPAVLRENYASLKALHLQQAAKLRPALVRVAVAGLMVAIGVGFYVFKQQHFTNAASRLFQPFAQIAPLYRTLLTVEPGDVQATPGSTVRVRVRIVGERPSWLAVRQVIGETSTVIQVPVPPGALAVDYTFPNLQRSLTYTVTGGDFTTPVHTIEVPLPPQVNLVRATLHLPDYTRVAPQKIETSGGDLEALHGTRAALTFVLDQPADQAVLLLEGGAAKGATNAPAPRQLELRRLSPTEFSGELTFADLAAYQVRVQRGKQAPGPSLRYGLRVLPDQPPQLALSGLDKQAEVQLGSVLPLKLTASDDYGLSEVGLFARRALGAAAPTKGATNAPTADAEWHSVATWPQPNLSREFKSDHSLAIASLGAVEGERVEIALRARDADPAKAGVWTTGESYTLLVGGEGTIFQILYEQILQSEADLKQLIRRQQQGVSLAASWMQKFDPASGLRWDDAKNLDALATAMRDGAKSQEQLRQTAGATARNFVSAVGTLRFSLGMLADTEMIRLTRVLESVATQDTPPAKRAALAEARFTAERTIASLNEMLGQYVAFRQNWELANMTPFLKMLADRELAFRDESLAHASKPTAPLAARSAAARQAKVLALACLAQTALAGVGERVTPVDAPLGQAFTTAAVALDSSGAKTALQQAVAELTPGRWSTAATAQTKAATALADIHAKLKQAGAEAMARAMKEVELKTSQLAAQQALEKMLPGSGDKVVNFRQDLANLSDVVQMRETVATGKPGDKDQERGTQPAIPPDLGSKLKTQESAVRPDLSTMFLGTRAEKTAKIPGLEGLSPNQITAPLVPDKLEDLVGKLLEEADEMEEKFDTLALNSGAVAVDPGEVSKMGGRLNSNAATSTTGNKKPPTANVGGMSGTGRQGARSYGKVAGSESPNMRGRDKVQEGQFEAPDQEGVLKEKKTDDMQKDQSTGIGGKRVESDDTKFSLANKGEWSDKFADRMQKPQAVNHIVERQGKPLDPKVAALLRDMDGNQKQLIERANALRKELKNLYLPTDHLDDLIAQLNQNLEKLREAPTAETFRTQQELLDRLRSEARVFQRASTGFQPSLPRNQQVRGRILDEPAGPVLPRYEQVVKEYYRRLAAP
ncbi:MAG: hypothetical protein RL514_3270 [Verrucomicrobiota bacterium]